MIRTLLLLLATLWAGTLLPAQGIEPISIREFHGLNTAGNELLLQPGQATIARNIDFSISTASLNKRKGFGVYTTDATVWIPGLDTINSIYGFVDSRNRHRLFSTYSADSYSDYLVFSNENDTAFDNIGFQYAYHGSDAFYQEYGDIVIMGNGGNTPLKWYDERCDPLVPQPTGRFDYVAVPSQSTDFLDGYYYYAFIPNKPCSTGTDRAFRGLGGDPYVAISPSYRVPADSQWIMIYGRSDMEYTPNCATPDSVILRVCRTRAGNDVSDSLFYVGELRWANADTNTYFTFIDSVPDDSLTPSGGNHNYAGRIDTMMRTRTLTSDNYHKVGSPDFIARDTCGGGYCGITNGETDSSWTYTAYYLAYYDTLTGALTDTTSWVRLQMSFGAAGMKDSAFTIGLPHTPSRLAGYVKILYRRKYTQTTMTVPDSSYIYYTYDPIYNPPWYHDKRPFCYRGGQAVEIDGAVVCRVSEWKHYDTTISSDVWSPLYVVDTIKPANDTDYVDAQSWSTVYTNDVYYSPAIITQWNYPTIYNNRLYMAQGSRVHYSQPGDPLRFMAGSASDIGPSDGDEITGMVGYGALWIFKNKSIYEAEHDNEHDVIVSKPYVRGVGCIASKSLITLPGGDIVFLSEYGVQSLATAAQLQSKNGAYSGPSLSGLIQNRLDAIDIDDKRECCAWLTPNGKGVVFSFPTIDTSFVYFPATGDWAEWTPFAFKDVTRFSTEYNRGIRPSSLVLGILDAADSMFRYGNVATDTGHAIHAQYRTGPIGVSADYWKILKYGLWKQSNDSDSIMVRFYDEDNAQVYIHDDSTQYRYRKIAANPTASRYFKIDIQTYADSLAIQGLDLWPQFEGKAKEH